MDNQQRKYLAERLNQIVDQRVTEAVQKWEVKNPEPAEVKLLKPTLDQIYDTLAVALGAPARKHPAAVNGLRLIPRAQVNSYTDLDDAFETLNEAEHAAFEKKHDDWCNKRDKLMVDTAAKLHAERARIMDEIMLGDADSALKKLEAFAAGRV